MLLVWVGVFPWIGACFGSSAATTTTSFFSPGFDSLEALFSKGFFVYTTISGFFSYFLLVVSLPETDLSFLASLYLSSVDLLYV